MKKPSKHQQHQPRKRFGQNFLHDQNIINQIVDSVGLQRDDWLVEIGPGMGALTEPLLKEVDSMTVIELDTDLSSTLRIRIGANSHNDFTIIENNAMHVNFTDIWIEKNAKYGIENADAENSSSKKKLRVVGNLPYNISTPLLFRLLEFSGVIEDMHFMLQKEVVDRITAEVGSKTYGRLSVTMQYFCHCDYLLTVPNGAFNPPPKVTSAVFRLTPHITKPIVADDENLFTIIVRECFNHRRKTLRAIFKKNAILPSLCEDAVAALEEMGISVQARPETLSVNDFVVLSNYVKTLNVSE